MKKLISWALSSTFDNRLMDAAGGTDGGQGGGTGGGQGGGTGNGGAGGAGGDNGGGTGGTGGGTGNGGAGGAGGDNGGGTGGTGGAGGGTGGTGGAGGGEGSGGTGNGGDGGDKPFLGNKPPENKNGNEPPNAPDEKTYLDAVKKDEAVFGKDDNIAFDQNLVKAVIPACQKHGITPEAAKDIANAFAKAQFDAARAAYKERCDYFAKLNGEARAKYTDGDFEQINAGIDKWFKPGGVMNNVIRNSELGADPEFLALMHELGKAAKEDKGAGAAAGGGEGTGDANGISGLSKLW
jgi:hypothetical protein